MTKQSVILFDAECLLCSANARFVLRHDRQSHFRLASVQSKAGRAFCRHFGVDADTPATMLVIEEGRASRDSDAAIAVLRGLGGGWLILALLLRAVPRPLRDAAYRLVARNRYRWFGRRTCALPTEELH